MEEPSRLEAARQAVVERYGEWTAHNIHLGAGVYTRGPTLFGDEFKLIRATQLIESALRRPWSQLRIADLGCGEGLYACEFALRGAHVVGIEGREASIAKARFAKDALSLERLDLIHADVRTLDHARYGSFDVVLCWGLLYHLDTPDVFELVEKMREVCDGVAVIDTHVSFRDEQLNGFADETFLVDPSTLGALERRTHHDREYWGRSVVEHLPDSSREERLRAAWASLDNPSSFWPTRSSLTNLLVDSGFATVLEAHAPRLGYPPDRVTLVALDGGQQELLATPLIGDFPLPPLPEEPPRIES
jgi:2-polyprenyl-3-methyl-5-hydroxy-6-metoxy-1,4-benzoquinol methylase